MVFALLIAAILWNLGTWYFGLPASSSHTMVGSIIGVGIANQLMNPRQGTSGVDWTQAAGVGRSLLFSPIVGFGVAWLLLLLCKAIIKDRRLYEAPTNGEPPPFWIRALLVFTCTGVSFCAWIQRRTKRHGTHHADPDRHGAYDLCPESRRYAEPDRGLPGSIATNRAGAQSITSTPPQWWPTRATI